jgi:hypothetical protein
MTKNNSAAIYKIDDEIMSFIGSNILSGFTAASMILFCVFRVGLVEKACY